ncbi:MAG TPA: hypothetical protein VGZ29_10235 [Terriglobia bacterium]|nr:hypothetical protein [Terriglobia bacterium]
MRNRSRVAMLVVSLFLLSAALCASGAAQPAASPKKKAQKKQSTVYVCACLQTKSCSCMSEAKTEGPCACGTEGGPPMKAVAPDSDWAKQNRDALAAK